jgi:hypothetical protein
MGVSKIWNVDQIFFWPQLFSVQLFSRHLNTQSQKNVTQKLWHHPVWLMFCACLIFLSPEKNRVCKVVKNKSRGGSCSIIQSDFTIMIRTEYYYLPGHMCPPCYLKKFPTSFSEQTIFIILILLGCIGGRSECHFYLEVAIIISVKIGAGRSGPRPSKKLAHFFTEQNRVLLGNYWAKLSGSKTEQNRSCLVFGPVTGFFWRPPPISHGPI